MLSCVPTMVADQVSPHPPKTLFKGVGTTLQVMHLSTKNYFAKLSNAIRPKPSSQLVCSQCGFEYREVQCSGITTTANNKSSAT